MANHVAATSGPPKDGSHLLCSFLSRDCWPQQDQLLADVTAIQSEVTQPTGSTGATGATRHTGPTVQTLSLPFVERLVDESTIPPRLHLEAFCLSLMNYTREICQVTGSLNEWRP